MKIKACHGLLLNHASHGLSSMTAHMCNATRVPAWAARDLGPGRRGRGKALLGVLLMQQPLICMTSIRIQSLRAAAAYVLEGCRQCSEGMLGVVGSGRSHAKQHPSQCLGVGATATTLHASLPLASIRVEG